MLAFQIQEIADLTKVNEPLKLNLVPVPEPGLGEVLIAVKTCGVCHTELDEIEGRTPPAFFPLTPGHQVVGTVMDKGPGVVNLDTGDRVGVAWIFSACGKCSYCHSGQENLCPEFKATGRDAHGGYAEFMVAKADYCYHIPKEIDDAVAAPLLCAGAIGLRSLRLTEIINGQSLGLTGFGASGHLVLKLARYLYPDSDVYVFARSEKEQEFAKHLGAIWAGDTRDLPPALLDTIIDTTPVWKPVVAALGVLKPGGRLVINAIRKERVDQHHLLEVDYAHHLWMEKEIKSVANVTRKDVHDFLLFSTDIPIVPEYCEYPLKDANAVLQEIKAGGIRGAKVLRVSE